MLVMFIHRFIHDYVEVCKLAVSQNPKALEFVDSSLLGNKELALLAVNQDGLSIKLVDEVRLFNCVCTVSSSLFFHFFLTILITH